MNTLQLYSTLDHFGRVLDHQLPPGKAHAAQPAHDFGLEGPSSFIQALTESGSEARLVIMSNTTDDFARFFEQAGISHPYFSP